MLGYTYQLTSQFGGMWFLNLSFYVITIKALPIQSASSISKTKQKEWTKQTSCHDTVSHCVSHRITLTTLWLCIVHFSRINVFFWLEWSLQIDNHIRAAFFFPSALFVWPVYCLPDPKSLYRFVTIQIPKHPLACLLQ